MKPVDFARQAPASLADLHQLLARDETDHMILAGGQSLMPMLNLRLVRPAELIDIHGLEGLCEVRDDGDGLIYGAGITHAMIEDGIVPDATPGWLKAVASNIAYRAVRNRGTIGGSLAHADPAADWVSALTALGGEVILSGQSGTRAVALQHFFAGPFTTNRGAHEVLSGVRIPKRSAKARWGYWKFCRKVGEFAKAIGAVLIDPEREEIVALIGAIERPPLVIDDIGPLLADPRSATELVQGLLPDMTPVERKLHATALQRAVELANRMECAA